jgi:hypothetical protein
MAFYWFELLESVGEVLQEKGMITADERKETGNYLHELHQKPDAVFYYTFIQAEAVV